MLPEQSRMTPAHRGRVEATTGPGACVCLLRNIPAWTVESGLHPTLGPSKKREYIFLEKFRLKRWDNPWKLKVPYCSAQIYPGSCLHCTHCHKFVVYSRESGSGERVHLYKMIFHGLLLSSPSRETGGIPPASLQRPQAHAAHWGAGLQHPAFDETLGTKAMPHCIGR